MRHDIYTLPEIVIIGGQSATIRWRLFTEANTPFNANGCTGNFSVVDYSNPNDDPLIDKSLTFSVGDDETGIKNIASVDLSPSDTLDMQGKYIYQIQIRDIDGEAEIPNQGIMQITHNINTTFLR